MELAELVSSWSKDPSTKCGVVVVRGRKLLASGYNGFPPGIADDDRLHDRSKKYPRVIHAEMNGLLQAGHLAEGATLYGSWPGGGTPCSNCAKHIVTAGVIRVVVPEGEHVNENWAEEQRLGGEILLEAGVEISVIE